MIATTSPTATAAVRTGETYSGYALYSVHRITGHLGVRAAGEYHGTLGDGRVTALAQGFGLESEWTPYLLALSGPAGDYVLRIPDALHRHL